MCSLTRQLATAFLLVSAAAATPVAAQSGFALKGHHLYNGSTADEVNRIPSANGFSVGAELVLPLGLGIGVSGYAAGNPSDWDAATSSLGALAEANYFFGLPLLPVSPYIGAHAGLGVVNRDRIEDGSEPSFQDKTGRQLGVQAGVRLQLGSALGLDAQIRRVSLSASQEQDGSLERTQVLLGIALF